MLGVSLFTTSSLNDIHRQFNTHDMTCLETQVAKRDIIQQPPPNDSLNLFIQY